MALSSTFAVGDSGCWVVFTRLKSAEAHFVVDTLPDCLPVLERIHGQLLRGTLAT